jgi:hypothetical protein
MKIPEGWRYDGVWEKPDGDGCPYFERVEIDDKGEEEYTEKYEKACMLVSWGVLDAKKMPEECAACTERPTGPSILFRPSNVMIEIPDFDMDQFDAAAAIVLPDALHAADGIRRDVVTGTLSYESMLRGLPLKDYATEIIREFREIRGCSLDDEFKRIHVLFMSLYTDVASDNDPRDAIEIRVERA